MATKTKTELTLTLRGNTLLQHNARLVDPLNEHTKKIASMTSIPPKSRTEQINLALREAEWRGGIYFDPHIGVYVPTTWIEKCLKGAGSLVGRKGKALERALIVHGDKAPLMFDGPRNDIEALWEAEKYMLTAPVKNSGRNAGRVMRTRPYFQDWELEVDCVLLPTELSLEDFETIVDHAGDVVGLGDWRPRFGRFTGIVKVS